jgi:hypothetical protein
MSPEIVIAGKDSITASISAIALEAGTPTSGQVQAKKGATGALVG